MSRYTIIEPDSGDELGVIALRDLHDDDAIILALCDSGYLDLAPDYFELDESYPFADDGSIVVLDIDSGDPVLTLEPEETNDTEDDDENA